MIDQLSFSRHGMAELIVMLGQKKSFPMTTSAHRLSILLILFIGAFSTLRGEELLFHAGPPVDTPASTPVTPFTEKGSPKLIKFQREFFIDRDLFASLPRVSAEHENVSLSAVEAISLALKSVDPDGGLQFFKVTEVKLLKGPMTEKRPVDYYLVSMLANGSEAHRIVLMNGNVLSSRLREIKD
jgi:hypothetical protein